MTAVFSDGRIAKKNKNNNSLLLGSFCTFSLLNRLAERRHHWLRGDSCRITVRVISLEILATSNVDLPATSFMFFKTFFSVFLLHNIYFPVEF